MWITEYWPYLLIGIAAILIGVGIIVGIRSKKKDKIDVDWILDLIGTSNITALEQVKSRVRITVKDLDLVNLESLKSQTKGIFIKENTLVVTFISDTEAIVESLRRYL